MTTDEYVALITRVDAVAKERNLGDIRTIQPGMVFMDSACSAADLRAIADAMEPPASRWRPMESAPTDGTRILAYGHWCGEINGPDGEPETHVVIWNGNCWRVQGTDAYAAQLLNPTRWTPIPTHFTRMAQFGSAAQAAMNANAALMEAIKRKPISGADLVEAVKHLLSETEHGADNWAKTINSEALTTTFEINDGPAIRFILFVEPPTKASDVR